MTQVLKIDRCCSNTPKYEIVYDCGPEPDQVLLVCQKHYDSDECWRRFAKSTKVIAQ